MRRARSQLSKITQHQQGNQAGMLNPQSGFAMGNEVDQIQQRLNQLQQQQQQPHHPGMQPFNDPFQNQGFPQPVQSMGFQQPPQQQMQPQYFEPQQTAPNAFMQPGAPQAYQQQSYANPVMDQMQMMNDSFGSNTQLDNIKSSLEAMSAKLNAVNGANAATKESHNIALQQSEILKQHYNHINNELQGLKAAITNVASSDGSQAELQQIQQTLNANYQAIMQQLESSQGAAIDTSMFSSAIEASHKDLSQQIVQMKEVIDTSLNNPNHYAQTLEVSHDDITKRLDDMHNALQTAIAQPDLYISAIENNHRELSQQVLEIKSAMAEAGQDKGATALSEGPSQEYANIEMRLEEITRAVVALSLEDDSINNLERIEARVSDVAKTIDAMGTPQTSDDSESFQRLEAKLSDISGLLNAATPDLSGFETKLNALSDKFDNFNVTLPEAPQADFQKLEAKLSDMSALLSSSTPDMSGMENQISVLSQKLENLSSVSTQTTIPSEENNALLKRMDALVDQISQSHELTQNHVSNDSITQQLNQISSAIDALSAPVSTNASGDVVMQQLEQIAGAIDQLAAPTASSMSDEHIGKIERQLAEISGQLSTSSGAAGSMSLDPIASRLSGIEEQLGANRDITIELATKAAEDAVKMSVKAMPQMAAHASEIDTSSLNSMSEMLARLNRETENNNSKNIEAFGAVTQTLDMMVQKLAGIEAGLADKSQNISMVASPLMAAQQEMPAPVNHEPVMPQETMQETPAQPELQQEAELDYAQDAMQVEEQEAASSPASDLVKAARLANANAEMQASSPEADIPTAMSVDNLTPQTPVLPEVETPEMAMDSLPEVGVPMDYNQKNDTPLEPGSGAPDLAALVRQANNQRKNKGADDDGSGSDFIAAARRAAQAAAQEAGAVEEEIEENTKKGLLASLPELFGKRKKAIVMGAAALLFVALAVPLASKFIGGNETQIAALEETQIIDNQSTANLPQASVIPAENTVTATQETSTDETAIVREVAFEEASLASDVSAENASIETTENSNFELPNELEFGSDALKADVLNGNPAALFEIGKRYTDGLGTQKDLAKAAQWYEASADLGYAPAQYIIGNFNEKGLGVEKNPEKAAEWYKKAAQGGNIIAMHNLAVLTATPNALSAEPDMNEAFKWFGKAADYGVRDSQVNAGIFHTKGFGTEVNLVEAYKWFAIAAKAGDKDAANKRDIIENAIQPDQLEIAKSLVEEWKPLEIVSAANEVTIDEAWGTAKAVAGAFKIDRETIAQTQRLLSKVGFNAGTPDGIMGQKTRDAIAAFQRKTGMPVNGRIDTELLKTLKAIAV
jgi:localization factor PodJL